MHTIDYILPSWTIQPLFYADSSGLSDTEDTQLDDFIARKMIDLAVNMFSAIECQTLGFLFCNDLTALGGDCSRVTFQLN